MFIKNELVKSPKISIIITYYNLGKYIKDCVLSILNQEYYNFEIIIVNDNSDFENSKILQNFNNEKIKIINLTENVGQLLAFEEGLNVSSGEFVCMIDADDILLPNFLKTLLYVHLNNNFALVSASSGEINENNEITSLNSNSNPIKIFQKEINYKSIEKIFNSKEKFTLKENKEPFGLWNWNPSSSALFRKSALDILKYFPDKKYWKTGADKVIFSLLDLVGSSCNISAICYLYRHHNENNSQTTLTIGKKKYLSENYVKKLITWNKKLRIDTMKMFIQNKKELIEKYNKINYLKMLFRVIFCINIKICAKIIKTLAHKLIQL